MEKLQFLNLIVLLKKSFEFMRKYKLNSIHPLKFIYYKIGAYLRNAQITKVGNNIMFFDVNNGLGLHINSFWEKEETELVKRIIKEGDIVIDIGANIGYYTLLLAELVGNTGKVYAFEPERKNFNLLRENVKINGYKNVVLINKAISDKNKEIKLYLSKDSGQHKIYKTDTEKEFIKVKSTCLDDFFRDFRKPIRFIKIDIEGAEISALLKANNLINKSKEMFLLTEFFPFNIKKFGYEARDYLTLLKNYGFGLYPIYSNGVKKDTLSNILEKINNEAQQYLNLFCIKKEVLNKKIEYDSLRIKEICLSNDGDF